MSAACRHNVAAHSVGLENPPMTELRANTRASSGSWSQINQPPDTGRDACGVCGLALSTSMLIASLDPAVSKTNSRPHHPIAGSKSADTNDRMRITAGETVPSAATIRHAVRLRIPTRVYRTQLAGRRRALRGALDEGQIVDQPHPDAGQPQRLTAAPTDPAHWLLGCRSTTSPPPRVPVPALRPRAVDRTRTGAPGGRSATRRYPART